MQGAITSADIDALTQGRVDNRMLQNWRLKGEWLTPTPKSTSTRAYEYTFEHAAEAMIIAALDVIGIPHVVARKIIERRLLDRASQLAHGESTWRDDVQNAILSLPDFRRGADRVWVVFLASHGRGQPAVVISVRPERRSVSIADAVDGSVAAVLVLDVSAIIARLRTFIAARGARRT